MRLRSTGHLLAPALVVMAATSAVASPVIARRLSDRPPPAHTGGFGEPTCAVCHFDTQVDDGKGKIELRGLPALYTPGRRYELTLSLGHAEMASGGFQMSARFAEGARRGSQAGILDPVDGRVDVTPTSELPIQYARHTYAGTRLDSAEVNHISWRIVWTAPQEGGAVVFHVAANAASDDMSPLGDYIYTKSFELPATRE